MKMDTEYPLLYEIRATIRAPAGATPEDVKRVVHNACIALDILEVKLKENQNDLYSKFD